MKPALFTEHGHVEPPPCDEPGQLATVGRIAEVAGGELGPHAVVALDLGGQLAQPVLAPGDQEDAVPAGRELAGELLADSADAPVITRWSTGLGQGGPSSGAYPEPVPSYNGRMEGSNPFGGMFGDPDDLQRRLGEFAEQMQGAQRVAWADNAIKLAVDMTVAAIHTIDLSGSSDEQATQVRDAIRLIFPEAVTLVREAREGLA